MAEEETKAQGGRGSDLPKVMSLSFLESPKVSGALASVAFGLISTLWLASLHFEDFLCALFWQRLRKGSEVEVLWRESWA